jgi:PAS domain S-box-containing protein
MTMNLVMAAAATLMLLAFLWMRRAAKQLLQGKDEVARIAAELKQQNAMSTQKDNRYRTLFDSMPVGIVIARMDGSLVDINRAGANLFGYDNRDQLMPLNMRNFYVNPAERDRRMAAIGADPFPRPIEVQMRRKDGTTFPALVQNHAVRDSSGQFEQIEGFVTDITEIKRLQADREALAHDQRISARLQSVGALAAGIAHEINTPMQFVSDSVYFLKSAVGDLNRLWPELQNLSNQSETAEGLVDALKRIEATAAELDVNQLVADAHESADRALEGIRRVTKIIRAMREFAHPDNGEHSKVDLNAAIETTLTVCKNVYKEIADVQTEFAALPPVMCQYGEINQVFLNIVVNAAHAIESQHKDGSKGLIRISTLLEEPWAVVRIQDNGAGIPETVKARIFDPFFTTKEVGKGTGQGLAIVQSVIVERHHGRIEVESQVGKGTTFVLRLPIQSQQSTASGVSHE